MTAPLIVEIHTYRFDTSIIPISVSISLFIIIILVLYLHALTQNHNFFSVHNKIEENNV